MRILVTGQNGYIGKHVVAECVKRGHEITHGGNCDAVIHLAWRGLPNYTSTVHYENVYHQVERMRALTGNFVRNITVAGTCLETVENPPNYAKAKLAILEEVQKMECDLKWARLHYVFGGDGERQGRLVPQLKRAMERRDKAFSVIDGFRHFTRVTTVAWWLVRLAEQKETGIFDCCDRIRSVKDFCLELRRTNPIEIIDNYPMPSYEPKIIDGDPTRIRSIA